jgi:DNA replication protein DnaC
MTVDLDSFLKRLHLANARRVWRDLVQRAEKEEWAYDQLLYTLFDEEVAHRRGTRLTRAVRAAKFPFLRTVEEFDFSYQSTLRLTTIGSLLAPDFVTEGGSVIFLGKPGRGKTHLAISIAYRALQNGFDALFTTAAELIDHLSAATREGKMREALAVYLRPHVLVVDEVGYLTYGDDAANVLYHVVNDRQIRRRSMIFTTNKHPKRWGAALHDEDLAEAIVDRILERGRLIRLDGPSLRTKHLPGDDLADDLEDPTSSRVSGKIAAEFPEPTRAATQLGALGAPGFLVFSQGDSGLLGHYARRLMDGLRADANCSSHIRGFVGYDLRVIRSRLVPIVDIYLRREAKRLLPLFEAWSRVGRVSVTVL